ncbi:molybdate ABC transporter substrate-binding protein [Roseovarius spongiae]|uniref:Molybdate ABC transporter substrate-binding protein n=1 Tax=Roseovarius spongiae TaxID=2320272 RepID=A0A3A8AXM8_9RHOB|nr:molybdate ABC transporter substrate-binding protein [Roseovarius spongiae]RKF16617.1 molybdate ABC transporter substrate-binding protein [Roseovarius spongiae]
MKHLAFLLCLLLAAAAAAPLAAGGRVTVFAAASLQGALDEVVAAWPGEAAISYGGSGAMARQIAQGAPADLVVLANVDWMDWLVSEGLVTQASVVNLLGNRLVLVGPADSPDLQAIDAAALLGRLDGGRLAMGETRGVPAGIYGRAWLEDAGLWDALAPRLAETENVRVALALVARSEAPLGVVYATDALAEPGVRILYEAPEDPAIQILYPAAPLTTAGKELFAHLRTPEAAAIFARHGFAPPGAAP